MVFNASVGVAKCIEFKFTVHDLLNGSSRDR